jgi:hypothetical protein
MSTSLIQDRPSAAFLASPKVRRVAVVALSLVALAALYGYALNADGTMFGLSAAGVAGDAPEGAGEFKKLIHTLQSNLMWVILICVGLAVSVGGMLMMFGHSRANDHLIRIGGGIFVVLVLSPAVVA